MFVPVYWCMRKPITKSTFLSTPHVILWYQVSSSLYSPPGTLNLLSLWKTLSSSSSNSLCSCTTPSLFLFTCFFSETALKGKGKVNNNHRFRAPLQRGMRSRDTETSVIMGQMCPGCSSTGTSNFEQNISSRSNN